MPSSFRDLRVWQEAMKLASGIYRATADFLRHELYGLSQQMRRAAVSVPSNIAEGKGRASDKELLQFLANARGSIYEVQTQIALADRVGYLDKFESSQLSENAARVGQLVKALIRSYRKSAAA